MFDSGANLLSKSESTWNSHQPTKVSIEKTWDRICKRLKSPGIDSKTWARICKCLRSAGIYSAAYVAWQAGTTNSVVVQARQAENRFLGSLKGLQIRALCRASIIHSVQFIVIKRIILIILLLLIHRRYLYRIIQNSRPKIVWCWQRGIEPFEDTWLWPAPPPPTAVLLTPLARFFGSSKLKLALQAKALTKNKTSKN